MLNRFFTHNSWQDAEMTFAGNTQIDLRSSSGSDSSEAEES